MFCLGILAATCVLAQGSVPQNRGAGEITQELPSGTTVITNRPRTGAAPGQRTGVVVPLDQMQRLQPDPPAKDRVEFQDFVQQATGRDLPLFGAELFREPPSTFAPVDNIPVTPDYVIGPGDEILIRAWGQIDVDQNAIVDRSGTISIPKVGVLNVAGIRYQDLPGFLKTSFGRVFRNFELTASLGRLRAIQVFVVGQAKRPGTYTVSSLSTLVTALFSVGGPSTKGSMRSIQLKRGNKVVVDMDLYDMLVSGDKSKDAQLLPGDVIYIPPVGELVAVTGSVNVPAIYELKKSAPLSEVLGWAGGLAITAQGQKATVERIDDRTVRKVDEFTLDITGLARRLKDGDLVTVYALTPRFDNVVTLRGNVAQPGRLPWRAGMRITDLIPSREALISRDFWLSRAQIVGRGPNAFQATEQTRSSQDRRQESGIDRTRLLNQITPSLKEVNWDYALIERIQKDDLRSTLVPFNLGKAVLEGDPQQNLILQPGDVVTIFSKEDLPVSAEKQTRFIRLEGEFRTGGIFQINPGETLRQLVTRVGGFAPNAYLFGSEFMRESTRLQQQKNLDEAISRLERDAQRAASTRAQNAVTPEDTAALKQQTDSQQALIGRLRALRPTGRIVLALPENAALKDLPDLPLEDGDRFLVPSPPSMVTVFGSVYNENAYIYRPDRRVADYLAQAGGPTRDADERSIYVLRADGSVISRRQSGFFSLSSLDGTRLMPGDTIVVPEELDKTTITRTLKDFAQIFYQFGLGAAAIKVLRQ